MHQHRAVQAKHINKSFPIKDCAHISPHACLFTFDLLFFSYYAIGWYLTKEHRPEVIADNAIVRVFGVSNICIGTDSWPAQPVASVFFVFAFVCFAQGVFLHLVRLHFVPGAHRALRKGCLYLSLILASAFSLTLSVPPANVQERTNTQGITIMRPIDVHSTHVHCVGFLVGLMGYGILKFHNILEFGANTNDEEWKQARHLLHISTEVISFFVFFLGGLYGFCNYISKDVKELLETKPEPGTVGFDWGGWALVAIAGIGPFINYTCAPAKASVHVFDTD